MLMVQNPIVKQMINIPQKTSQTGTDSETK